MISREQVERGNIDIDTEVGRRFKLETFSGAIECEVLASEPEHMLRYSWRTAEHDGDLDTVVTFVLTETDAGGTHLRLIHSGFPQPAAQVLLSPQHKAATISSAANDASYEVKLLWAA